MFIDYSNFTSIPGMMWQWNESDANFVYIACAGGVDLPNCRPIVLQCFLAERYAYIWHWQPRLWRNE